jgi:hypothetical protein
VLLKGRIFHFVQQVLKEKNGSFIGVNIGLQVISIIYRCLGDRQAKKKLYISAK